MIEKIGDLFRCPDGHKRCTVCFELKSVDEFHRQTQAFDGRRSDCKKCRGTKRKAPSSALGEARRMSRKRALAREQVSKLKDGPCADCGNRFHPFVMDFDHRPGEVKLMAVSKMVVRAYPAEKIHREIEKCDLVCSNCHRIRTWERMNSGGNA